jgi:hypothetical protein
LQGRINASTNWTVHNTAEFDRSITPLIQQGHQLKAGERADLVENRRAAIFEEFLDFFQLALVMVSNSPSPNVCVIGDETPSYMAKAPPSSIRCAPLWG